MSEKKFFLNSAITKTALNKKSKNLRIAGYANTTAKDRAGDIITAEAWAKGVDNFRNNPVLLFQHKHDQPIGRVTKIAVDKKGIFVEADVSEAAEKTLGVQTLIKDGALKSFSVGFRVKDGKYNRNDDSMVITDVELLEISVVSVPCNQDSLFSLKKSFGSDDDYENFVEAFKEEDTKEIDNDSVEEKSSNIMAGMTCLCEGHYHTIELDKNGNGVTTYASHMHNHSHRIINHNIMEADGHTHDIAMLGVPHRINDRDESEEAQDKVSERPLSPSEMEASEMENGNSKSVEVLTEEEVTISEIENEAEVKELEVTETKEVEEEVLTKTDEVEEIIDEKDDLIEEDNNFNEPIPFVNLLAEETAKIKNGDYIKYQGKRFKVTKIATAQSPTFKFLEVDLEGKDCDNSIDINVEDLILVNTWDLDTKYDLVVNTLESKPKEMIKEEFSKFCNVTELELFKFKESRDFNLDEQNKLNNLFNLVSSTEWDDSGYKIANRYVETVKALKEHNKCEASENSKVSLALKLHGYFEKENDKMTDQVVDTIDLTQAGDKDVTKSVEEVKTEKASVQVSEPEVAKLVEKTGEAIISESDAKEKSDYTPRESEELAELKAQLNKYREEVKALSESKMHYNEQKRNVAQFSEKEMANAVLLAKCLNKRDIFDTTMGAKMKAITTVDQFLSNFSSNIYTEMEQQLIVAPMFNRVAVDARTFRVPVADEDTDGDVAQFASGTFATGIGDTTNVPTSNQNTISAVEFTPHKFMATTHLAKDEEEDTVLPLLEFLRAAATRRMARAIDKSILRGTGALAGFTASPTNAISAGTGYASVIEGITNLTGDASITVSTGNSADKVDPTDIAAARSALGKYGLQLGDQLVFLTSIEGYNNLVTTSDFRTVDKFGPNATYLTGSVGAVYGIPIQITEFLDNVGATGNHLGVLLYKPGFMIAERRGIEVESEYEPRQQVTAMYMSTRFDFKALTTNASAALDSSKYSYACTILAG